MKNKLRLNRIFLFLILGLLVSPMLSAQKPNYKFKSINQPDGLINGTVQTIFEDSYGFIWLGTHQGIQRYDGKTYKNFEHKDYDSIGLSQNYINDFCEDGDRNIWITTNNGLNTYFRETDQIKKYNWNNKAIQELGVISFVSIHCDENYNNILWISTINEGLIKLNMQDDSATIYAFPDESETWFQCVLAYPGQVDKLLIGGNNLYAFDKTNGEFQMVFETAQNAEPPNNRINDIAIDPTDENILWLATGDIWGRGTLGGLVKYDLESNSALIMSNTSRANEIPDNHILQVCFYNDNELWVGTRNYGALLFNRQEDRFYSYSKNEYDEGSFTTENAVRSMVLDKSGTLWFGTWGDGISLLSPALQKFSHYKHLPDNKNGLPDNYITGIAEDNGGNIWFGTMAGGLSKFDPILKTFENYFQEIVHGDTKPIQITYLFCDSRNQLWIGTYEDALYRFNPVTHFKEHFTKGKSNQEVSQKRISAITEFVPGEIYISTYGGGLNVYNYETNSFKQYLHDPADSTSIPDNQIWLPFEGDDGNYYFGGNSLAGIIQFNPATQKFQKFTSITNVTTFLMAVKSKEGRVFIDAVSKGLSELKIHDDVFVETIYDGNGNSIKNVESMVFDNDNNLWMGTGNGLVMFNPDTKAAKWFYADDGLHGYAFSRFTGFLSSNGDMYFGGKNGFSVFNPNDISMSEYEPPVVFTDFKLYQESVSIGRSTPLKQSILLMDELELDYDENDFSFTFTALDFSNPERIEYKYILENHDDDWIHSGYTNVAAYTNMDPGEYTLKVSTSNGDGVWNHNEKSIRIIINPPWWQTNFAYFIYVLLILAAIFAVDRIQRKRLKEKAIAQSKDRELKQAKEIEKAYVELKATQKQLIQSEKMASLGELTAGIAHEIQNPLNFVNNFSEVNAELITELKEEIDNGDLEEVKSIANDIAENEDKIMHHGKRASFIVNGMLEHSRTGSGEKTPTDINVLAEEFLKLSYHGIRAKDKSFNAEFKTEFDKDLTLVNVVSQDFGRVILNLINNAFYAVSSKASATGNENYKPSVTVKTKKLDGKIEISVSDNGFGIPNEIKDKIFQPFFTTKPTGEGTGLGLSLSYDIITKGHGGVLKVKTTEGEGSEFIIQLPA